MKEISKIEAYEMFDDYLDSREYPQELELKVIPASILKEFAPLEYEISFKTYANNKLSDYTIGED